jgi:hypothetical protein
MAKDLTPPEVLEGIEPSLHRLWARRNPAIDTMIVIGDARRDGVAEYASGSPSVARTLFDRGGKPRVFHAYLQPLHGTIAAYEKAGRPIGGDIRHHKDVRDTFYPAAVPVLVVTRENLWATLWSPDGSVIHITDLLD